ncbi:MAG: gas vesicle protein K [Chlamydiae bacterium]|nr:gas vesicle protein K [Chlamydiota bacterium]MBI3266486.1 gas vesicle protein K [Chlamydiota bacterium]
MKLEMNDKDLKQGLFGLVLAIVEVIRDTLRIQALKRMEGGSLTEDEINRLGVTLMELDKAIEHLKEEQGVTEAVRSVREGLDDWVDSMVQGLTDPYGIAPSRQTNKEKGICT